MKRLVSPAEAVDALTAAGLSPALARIFGATSDPESKGDPWAVGDKGHAFGLWQVNDQANPGPAARVKALLSDKSLSASDQASSQAQILASLMTEAARSAKVAADSLAARGMAVGNDLAAAMIDAVWEHGAGNVQRWASSTAFATIDALTAWRISLGAPKSRMEDFLSTLADLPTAGLATGVGGVSNLLDAASAIMKRAGSVGVAIGLGAAVVAGLWLASKFRH